MVRDLRKERIDFVSKHREQGVDKAMQSVIEIPLQKLAGSLGLFV